MPAFPDPYAHDPAMPDRQAAGFIPVQRGWLILGGQFAALIILSIVCAAFDLDRKIAGLFYTADSGWFLARKPLWAWLHRYGTIPGLVVTLAALAGWGASIFMQRLRPLRRPCMVVALTSIIAAGLLVNAVFKQYWGRPRPDQTIEFGGQWQYQHILPPGTPGKGASFPCGHCTMGFVFLAMMAFRKRTKYLAYGGVGIGIVLGTLLSAARVVQGAHFVSDTIWSLGFITMTATALCMLPVDGPVKVPISPAQTGLRSRKLWVPLLVILALGLVGAGFLTRRPYYKSRDYQFDLGSQIERIEIQINADPERIDLRYSARSTARLRVDVHGFGWIKFDYHMRFDTQTEANTLQLQLHSDPRSYFAELDHALTLILPEETKDRIKVFFRGKTLILNKTGVLHRNNPEQILPGAFERGELSGLALGLGQSV